MDMAYRVLGRAGPPAAEGAQAALRFHALALLHLPVLQPPVLLRRPRPEPPPRRPSPLSAAPARAARNFSRSPAPCDPSGPTPGSPALPAPAAGAPSLASLGPTTPASEAGYQAAAPSPHRGREEVWGTGAVLEFIRVHPDVRALGTEPHSSTGTTAAGWTGTGKEGSPTARPGSIRPRLLGHFLRPRIPLTRLAMWVPTDTWGNSNRRIYPELPSDGVDPPGFLKQEGS